MNAADAAASRRRPRSAADVFGAAGVNSGPPIVDTAAYAGLMEIGWPEDPNYNEAKQIANARFDYLRPAVICYCQNEDDVRQALRMAKTEKLHVRIRSSG